MVDLSIGLLLIGIYRDSNKIELNLNPKYF